MYSACKARLDSELSGLKLQAIINGQIDASNCLEWGNKISKTDYFEEINSIHSIYDRLITDPDFMVSELYYSSLKSLIINFSATLEFFLKDSMRLHMMRNYSLLKKGLIESKQVIDPKDIVDIDDIESVRFKYIKYISNGVCSGDMWSGKLKKYVKFLDLPNDLLTREENEKIDNIWKMRNDIAHLNNKVLSINYDGAVHQYGANINVEQYTEFALFFVKLLDETMTFLGEVDELSIEKWKTTDATLLHRKQG